MLSQVGSGLEEKGPGRAKEGGEGDVSALFQW